ncbi:MAG: C25 family cysteine peptidase [Candidatus Poribacteria bacterium]|nr:C25 family cysteine peptidase [Candidatus Poribacteria bacterium]
MSKTESRNGQVYTTNRFFPDNLAEIRTAGKIRENRVLPIQLNPIQYNPVSGEVKLYHRLVVEVQFNRLGNAPSAIQGFQRPESPFYEKIFGNLLINPQTAKQWRSPIKPMSLRDDSSRDGTLTADSSAFSLAAAPAITSPRYKVIIIESGMYRITASDLVAAGVDITTIRPTTLTLSNKGKQIPIFVRNTDNGRTSDGTTGFDTKGEIIFYGERHSGEKTYIDPHSDENVYWLSWNEGTGLRMETKVLSSDMPGQYEPKNFLTRVHFEKDNQFRRFKDFGLPEGSQYNEIGGGIQQRFFILETLPELPDDSWFWTQLSAPEIKAFPFTLAGVAETGQKATIRVSLHGRSAGSHFTELWLNNDDVFGNAEWSGEREYLFENQQISQSYLKDGRNAINARIPEFRELDLIMLNWFEIDYWRTFEAKEDVLPFSITFLPDDVTGNVNPYFKVELENFSNPNIEIYGVDGTRYVGLAPTKDNDRQSIYNVVFQSSRVGGAPQNPSDTLLDTAIQYIALTSDKFLKPEQIIKDTPSDLQNPNNGADYIIITYSEFLRDVQPLANFRNQQGMRTKVVDVQNIYDEFNHGIPNPYKLREFLKYAYENWQPPAPTYVLLIGDTTPKDKISFVPTIQVQIPGYGSSASDHQFVTFRGHDSFPDMLIGRAPATNSIDVRIFVERAINYESTAEVGPWHKRILMLAGSDERFHIQTDELIEERRLTEKYETKLIYAPPTAEDELTLGEGSTPVGRQVIESFNDGATLVNYIGHGGGGVWSSSRMMDLEDPEKNLTNISQLPFVISMTCFTGEFDSPTDCLAEALLRSESGGAIGVIGGTSIGLLDGDHLLNKEIFEVIFNDNTQHIGAILAEAKTQLLINSPGFPDLVEVFTLFGDPATRLRLPHTQMQVSVDVDETSEQENFKTETLLSISGTLPNPEFSGDAEITVLPNPPDREMKKKRSQRRSPNIAIRRSIDTTPRTENVSVVNGTFKTQILIPFNSAFDALKLKVYAWNTEEDAIGYLDYTPLERYIKNIRLEPYPVPPDQPVHIYADAVNESLIDEITLYWSLFVIENRRTEADAIPMVRHEGTTYRTEQPIPAHPLGDLIDYYLLVKPKNGRILNTKVVTYEIGETDLTVLEHTINWSTDTPFLLSAQIKNRGTLFAKNVPVRFFQMPATDSSETQEVTLEMLQNATSIGEKIISEVPPEGLAVASVPWQPDPGKYLVTVFVDMPSTEQPEGILIEERENNNSASREFVNNQVFLTPENTNKPIQSSDGILRITIPPENSQILPVMTFETEKLTIVNQPDIIQVPTATEQTAPLAYRLDFSQPTELTGTATFMKNESPDVHIYMRDDETRNWIRVGKQTDNGETISAEVKLPGTFALLSHTDSRPPALELTVENQGFIDGDYISDTPTISARIEDANGIDPRPANIILTKNGNRVPRNEYTISASPISSNVLLITYSPLDTLQAGEYRIRLQAQDANGNVADTERTARVAGGFQIKNIANFPNPFRPGQGAGKGTDFAYYLTESADKVTLKIYTLTGKLITTIDTLDAATSYNEYHFDGLDADGEPLANGVYIYKFTATNGDERAQKVGKIVVLK